MSHPIYFENSSYLVHGFRSVDLKRFANLTAEAFRILSDDHTLQYIPSKRMKSLEENGAFLREMVINTTVNGRN